ncbi:MAG: methylated-DNA--[protein]-cysteine S-methyltransferase [Thermaurantiacus tibetensis]|uniref:methylated-DNA--[protein]-cysteine S-methyltransferase n=1 Tax=Thermaurantiacus tibetensis TaxID=2759035 RepID=UPI00188F0ABA|nr:methylated-DNA--[protein]-cysteine S-methyltransferase [Thermaurantiacus tibetensis]
MLNRSVLATPLGQLVLVHGEEEVLWAAEFHDAPDAIVRSLARFVPAEVIAGDVPVPARFADAFAGYFAGAFDSFDEIMTGRFGSPFERAVWAAVRAIPPGETRSYAAIAAMLGDMGRARAVGAASARNPLLLVVPCHRVIGSDDALVGYAGGLDRKAWLLRHEGWTVRQGRLV